MHPGLTGAMLPTAGNQHEPPRYYAHPSLLPVLYYYTVSDLAPQFHVIWSCLQQNFKVYGIDHPSSVIFPNPYLHLGETEFSYHIKCSSSSVFFYILYGLATMTWTVQL